MYQFDGKLIGCFSVDMSLVGGHVDCVGNKCLLKQILQAELNEQWQRGRPRRRFQDFVKSNLQKRGYNWRVAGSYINNMLILAFCRLIIFATQERKMTLV